MGATDSASWIEGNDVFPNTNWCLLLPDPDPDPSSVATVGDGVAATIARERLAGLPEPRGAALVVGDGFDPDTVRSARARLGPGGVAYLEGDHARHAGTAGIRRLFLESGFDDVAFYASSPASHRRDVSWWIPVGSSPAVRFVAAARAGRRISSGVALRGRIVRLAYRVVRAVPQIVRARPWLLHPARPAVLCAVAVVGHGSGGADPTPGVARDAVSAAAGPSQGRPTVLIRAGGTSTDQPMAFVFADRSDVPVALVKVPALDEEISASRHESTILHALTEGTGGVPGVPRPLGGRSGRLATFAQTFVPGEPVAAVVRPATLDSIADAMTEWTIRLAEATAVPVDETWGPAHLEAVLAELGATIGADVADRLRLALAEPMAEVTFAVLRHRDLGPWNVHLDAEGAVGVIDWADAAQRGAPLADLVHHLVHLELCAGDAYAADRRAAAIGRSVAYGPASVTARCMDRYAAATGLDPAAIPALRVVTWLVDLARQEADAREGSMYLTLLRDEIRRSFPRVLDP